MNQSHQEPSQPNKSSLKWLIIIVILIIISVGIYFAYTKYYKKSSITKPSTTTTNQEEIAKISYPLVDTGQTKCYNDSNEINCPNTDEDFYGQDAQYTKNVPSYTDNGDNTITDNVTGLMWQKDFKRISWEDSFTDAKNNRTGSYSDWRVPTIKELYSLINFNGNTGSARPESSNKPDDAVPFIDVNNFNFEYGQTTRYIDAQYLSATEYVSTTMGGDDTIFGVNFADGRIKGYPKSGNPQTGLFYARYVRDNSSFGKNSFSDNGDETISDKNTGLIWSKKDNGEGLLWKDSLAYCENLVLAGLDDWRLPNTKELQGIVNYTRSPDTTNSPAIDPIFDSTSITNEADQSDYPFYWTSTTHLEGEGIKGAYVAFGRVLGYMKGIWMDVHGAGSQRSDPKSGNPNDYPTGHGPQGDAVRINNYSRCVR